MIELLTRLPGLGGAVHFGPLPGTKITMSAITATHGAVNLDATVAGGLSVSSVQFQVDGANVQAAETNPYTGSLYRTLVDLDTLTVGSRSFTAILTEVGGAQTTSPPVTVTVARAAQAAKVAGHGWYRGRSTSAYTTDETWLNRLFDSPNIHIGGQGATTWASIKSDATTQATAFTPTTFSRYKLMFTPNMLPYNTSATAPDGTDATITAATNASPIAITATAHGYSTGNIITVSGVTGNTAANGAWAITVTGANTFTLNGSTGNGAYVSGGTATSRSTMTAGAAGFYTSTGGGGTNHWATIFGNIAAQGWGVSGKTIIIRVGHEFTGNWFPWNARQTGSGGTGTEFGQYLGHVMDVAAVTFTDYTFDFCGNAYQPNSTSAQTLFSGAYNTLTTGQQAKIGTIGFDIYDNTGLAAFADRWSAARGGLTFGTFTGGLGLDYLATFAASKSKPVSIGEYGLNDSVQTEDTQWTEAIIAWIKDPTNNVGLHVYYNGGNQDIVNASGPIAALVKSALIYKREFGAP